MATFSLDSASTYQGRKLRVYCTSTTNIAGNYSTINWTLYSEGGSSSYYDTGPTTLTIAGQQVYYLGRKKWDSKVFPAAKGSTSGSLIVYHDNLGQKSVEVVLSTAVWSATVKTASGWWALDNIPRYATSYQSVSSKTETSITMNWSSDSTIDYIWYSTNNGASWVAVGSTWAKSGSYTIYGLAANTGYNIKTRVRRQDSQLTTDSGTTWVATYQWPHANSMPNFTIGNTLNIGCYNPLNRTFTIELLDKDNNVVHSTSMSGTNISGYTGTDVIDKLYQSIPNQKSANYKVRTNYGGNIITQNGGVYSINESINLPEINLISYYDNKPETVNITQNNSLIIRNQSLVRYEASGLTTKNYASISSVVVNVNNQNINLSVSGSSASGGNLAIDSASNVVATFTITDSRGLTSSKTIEIQMLNWEIPTAIIMLERHNNFYAETDLKVDTNYQSIDGKNVINIKTRYRKAGTETWSSYETVQDRTVKILTLDNLFEWEVQVVITDLFGTITYNLFLQKGMPIMFIDRLKNSVGINCFPKKEENLELNGIDLSNTYSTNEIVIGTFEGKLLYRKLINVEESQVIHQTNEIITVDLGTLVIDNLVRNDVLVKGNNGVNQEVNKYIVFERLTKDASVNKIDLRSTAVYETDYIKLIIEYTKA